MKKMTPDDKMAAVVRGMLLFKFPDLKELEVTAQGSRVIITFLPDGIHTHMVHDYCKTVRDEFNAKP